MITLTIEIATIGLLSIQVICVLCVITGYIKPKT